MSMRRSEEQYPARRGQLARPDQWADPFGFGGSPWQMMRRMQEDMDRVFGQFLSPSAPGEPMAGGAQASVRQWAPNVDVSSTDQELCLEADLPGVNKDDIDVTVRDRHLILRAEMRQAQETPGQGEGQGERRYHRRERRYGYFERVLPLPEDINEDAISCDFRNGVLTVHIPRSAQQAPAARKIEVRDASQIPAETAGGRTRSQSELDMTEDEETAGTPMAGAHSA